tara:strand:- start:5615 stop:6133 length:519 start_codon:yes stop_codon:yes gene_type:complete
MNYNKSYSQKYTYIDDLPNVEDIEDNNNGLTNEQISKTQKFIRQNHLSNYDNMNHSIEGYNSLIKNTKDDEYTYVKQPKFNPNYELPPNSLNNNINPYTFNDNYHNYIQEGFATKAPSFNEHNCTCIDVNNHIQSCPICSKFYKNNYYVIYIIVIILLTVICLILLKKVLDK